MTTILVTGATGTVASRVVKALASEGVTVRAGVRSPDKASAAKEAGAEVVRLDFGDAASLEAAMQGVDGLFLLTPFVEDGRPLVKAAVDAAKKAGVGHILRMSALGADATSDFALAREHGEEEDLVKESGIAWTVIQPTFFMDNFVTFQKAGIVGQGAFYGASGSGKSAYIASDDIAAAASTILASPQAHHGKTYVLTGPEAHGDAQIAEAIGAAMGKEVKYVDLPAEQLASGMKEQGTPDWMVAALVGLENVKAQGWAAGVSPAVKEITGKEPRSFAVFLDQNAARLA